MELILRHPESARRLARFSPQCRRRIEEHISYHARDFGHGASLETLRTVETLAHNPEAAENLSSCRPDAGISYCDENERSSAISDAMVRLRCGGIRETMAHFQGQAGADIISNLFRLALRCRGLAAISFSTSALSAFRGHDKLAVQISGALNEAHFTPAYDFPQGPETPCECRVPLSHDAAVIRVARLLKSNKLSGYLKAKESIIGTSKAYSRTPHDFIVNLLKPWYEVSSPNKLASIACRKGEEAMMETVLTLESYGNSAESAIVLDRLAAFSVAEQTGSSFIRAAAALRHPAIVNALQRCPGDGIILDYLIDIALNEGQRAALEAVGQGNPPPRTAESGIQC